MKESTTSALLDKDRVAKRTKSQKHTEDWKKLTALSAAPPQETNLNKYTGSWGYAEAAHLLRRTVFGFSVPQIVELLNDGMETAVDKLLADKPLPEPPVNYFFEDDPDAEIGETWVYAKFDREAQGARSRSLQGWTVGRMMDPELSVREKMVLFWHNHFVTADIGEPIAVYIYSNTLRQHALGNFRELTKAITIDPAMLLFLNGNENNKFAPNENYARELLELFTVGKGPVAGPGDYTTFTEDDVAAMSKVLTGWRFRYDMNAPDGEFKVSSIFRPNLHDDSTKQLSHRFGEAVIQPNGAQEYADLIDVIFLQDECARFISRKLYRWFVHYKIDEHIEQNVIEPMAQLIIDNDYEIKPALKALLTSEHFYDPDLRGCMIKNPFDFGLSIFGAFQVQMPDDILSLYDIWIAMFNAAAGLQMIYYGPPQVAGWKAYYQEPAYYRIWINSSTIPIRFLIADIMALVGIQVSNYLANIDILSFIEENISDPSDPNKLVNEIAQLIFPVELPDEQKDTIKQSLIPGLPDFEWTVEYGLYLQDPTNPLIKASVETKLRSMLRTMMNLPEFNLS